MSGRRVLVNALSVTHGGGRSYAVNLIRELDRDPRGLSLTFLVPPGELAQIETRNVRIATVPLPQRCGPLRLASRILYEELVLPIRSLRYDLFYGIADLVSPLHQVPTIVALTNLNVYDHRFYNDLRIRCLEWLVRLGLRRADRLVCATRGAATQILEKVSADPARLRVVPHGIEASVFNAGPLGHFRTRYLFLPAALERHKNIEILLQALPNVGDTEIELWIAGPHDTDPEYARSLWDYAQQSELSSRVRFLGRIAYERMLSYYREATVMIFPSWIETFGHPLLEAMLAGTPVVASDIPAAREIAGDAAVYFPPNDAHALVQAIDRVLFDPKETDGMVQRGRLRAKSFSWKRSADELAMVFKDLLASQ